MEEIERQFFEHLYHSYIRLMLTQANRYFSSKEDAEDVIQESLEILMRNYKVLTTLNEKTLATYIVYTVRSSAINHLKRDRKKESWESFDELTTTVPSAEEMFFAALSLENLIAAWEQLTQDEQTLLVLKYFLDYSVKDLAAKYNCSIGIIKARLFRIRNKLKKLLAKSRGE